MDLPDVDQRLERDGFAVVDGPTKMLRRVIKKYEALGARAELVDITTGTSAYTRVPAVVASTHAVIVTSACLWDGVLDQVVREYTMSSEIKPTRSA
jgi:hypothetical protein